MTKIGEPAAAQGLMEVGGDSLRMLAADDFPAIQKLRETAPPEIFDLPGTSGEFAGFFEGLMRKPWSMPMLCCQAAEPVGACLMTVGQLKNLNAYLVAVFDEPVSAVGALALYIRHCFWSFPLHRIYTQLAMTQAVKPHIDLLLRAGFKLEGTLVGHISSADGPLDAVVVAILRDEFEGWCLENRPELSLT
jgi:hypothetical protein